MRGRTEIICSFLLLFKGISERMRERMMTQDDCLNIPSWSVALSSSTEERQFLREDENSFTSRKRLLRLYKRAYVRVRVKYVALGSSEVPASEESCFAEKGFQCLFLQTFTLCMRLFLDTALLPGKEEVAFLLNDSVHSLRKHHLILREGPVFFNWSLSWPEWQSLSLSLLHSFWCSLSNDVEVYEEWAVKEVDELQVRKGKTWDEWSSWGLLQDLQTSMNKSCLWTLLWRLPFFKRKLEVANSCFAGKLKSSWM